MLLSLIVIVGRVTDVLVVGGGGAATRAPPRHRRASQSSRRPRAVYPRAPRRLHGRESVPNGGAATSTIEPVGPISSAARHVVHMARAAPAIRPEAPSDGFSSTRAEYLEPSLLHRRSRSGSIRLFFWVGFDGGEEHRRRPTAPRVLHSIVGTAPAALTAWSHHAYRRDFHRRLTRPVVGDRWSAGIETTSLAVGVSPRGALR